MEEKNPFRIVFQIVELRLSAGILLKWWVMDSKLDEGRGEERARLIGGEKAYVKEKLEFGGVSLFY